jgi:predicted ester cyclase
MTEHTAAAEQAVPLDDAFLRDFAERWLAAWNSHDPKQVQALCTEDVESHDPTLPAPLHGWAGIGRIVDMLATAFPDYRFEDPEAPYAALDRPKAIAPWRFTGTMTGPIEPGFAPTNGRVEFSGIDELEFRGERVCRVHALFDVNGIAVQIRAAPAPGTRGEKIGIALQRLQAWALRRRTRR